MTLEPFAIRRAHAGDAGDCARIVNDWIDAVDWMPRIHSHDEFAGFVAEAIPVREVWVVGEPIAGYLSLNASSAQIMGLYTARPGAGMGKALMDRAKHGRDYLHLWTHEPNTSARRFYTREGFVELGCDADRSPEGVTEIRMEWRA